MSSISSITGVANVHKALEHYRQKIAKSANEGISETAIKVQKRAKDNLTESGAVHMGRLRSSIKVRFIMGGQGAEIYTNVNYAQPVEFGSKPHFPPIAPLSDWSRKKLGLDLGYVIARKISQEGTPAKPFMFPALEAERSNAPKNVANSMRVVFK